MTRANLDKRPGEVSAMFDKVADRYDLLNDVLSLGQDRWWRRVVAQAVAARAGERVLDLAAGTGTSSLAFTAAGADCVACDFSLGMLRWGSARRPRPGLRFVAGDAMRLPFADEAFDAVTISFGLRNVADHQAALAELLRVTRPGGRLVVCEFGHLPWPRLNAVYEAYLAARCPRWPGGCPATRPPTSTWPSPSGTGRPSPSWPGGSLPPGGRQYAGGT